MQAPTFCQTVLTCSAYVVYFPTLFFLFLFKTVPMRVFNRAFLAIDNGNNLCRKPQPNVQPSVFHESIERAACNSMLTGNSQILVCTYFDLSACVQTFAICVSMFVYALSKCSACYGCQLLIFSPWLNNRLPLIRQGHRTCWPR